MSATHFFSPLFFFASLFSLLSSLAAGGNGRTRDAGGGRRASGPRRLAASELDSGRRVASGAAAGCEWSGQPPPPPPSLSPAASYRPLHERLHGDGCTPHHRCATWRPSDPLFRARREGGVKWEDEANGEERSAAALAACSPRTPLPTQLFATEPLLACSAHAADAPSLARHLAAIRVAFWASSLRVALGS